ncbi:ATP-binding protein [Bartonella sp. F02]|uniref:ATP-binding protein n=1 Tax=Bartonella sp. F02 TaxID=2967262 RepID=UPI0022A932E7|nr:ATP-binding protein [Bartonella sp. F02]MCZ2328200.1 response regulator [Bartonella sp. F02]
MNKNFKDIEKSLSASIHCGTLFWSSVFVILFLFMIGFLDIFYPQSYFYQATLVSIFVLAIIGVIAILLIGLGALRYETIQLHKKLDFSFFNEVDDAIVISDISGFVYYSNKNYQKIYTYRPEASCYTVLSDLPDVDKLLYRLKIAAFNNHAAQEEFRVDQSIFIHSTEKKSVWYNISIQPITKRKKKLLLWRISDISHLKICHESFYLNLQEAIHHLDQAPVGFLSINAKGNILYSNAVFAEWFSIDLANFTTEQYSFDQLFSDVGNNKTWNEICLEYDKYQSSNCFMPYIFSLCFVSEIEDRQIFNCFMYASSLIENDIVYRMVLLPQQVQKSENNDQSKLLNVLLEYFDSSPFAIAVMNSKGQFIHLNSSFSLLTGCSDKTKNLDDLISHHDHAQLERIFYKIRTNKNYLTPIETILESNKECHLRLYFAPITQYDDNVSQDFVILSVMEITEQKTFEDKMVQSQKMQAVGQLAGGIAHDFNNVLTAILMSCDILLNTHRSFDPAHADLMNIKNNANRAAALVQQLLAFSRKQTLRPEKVDFTELLSDIRNLILPLLGNNIQLKIIHGRDLWNVEVDQASFQRVIMNLVINARDAMSDGGVITITTNNITKQQSAEFNYSGFVIGEYMQLTISDTGTGIPAKIQEKMFEPFFTTKEVGKGTGLGLSMVYGIIKQSGGYIYCDSQEGKGTAFHIFLPRYVSDNSNEISQKIEKTNELEKNTDLTGSATILIVEDEDAVRMGGVRALQMRGYNVLEAVSGVEALAVLEEKEGAIDLIVSDVVMPEMDGPTFLREARKKYPDIKFIFVSGYAKDAFTKNLPEDSVFGFLSKPFTLKQLALTVKEMLEQ